MKQDQRVSRLRFELESANEAVTLAVLALRNEIIVGDDTVTIGRGAWRAVEKALATRNAASADFWETMAELCDPLNVGAQSVRA